MLRINPVTAWRLLKAYVQLPPGSWVVQNAANSGVGRCVIQLAKKLGLRTVNFVRRPELIAELKALGADEVLLDDEDGLQQAKQLTADAPPQLAGNAVGGDSALRLMDLLGHGGTHITYGAMSMRSLKVPNKFIIFKELALRGLWVSKFLEHASQAELQATLKPLAEMIQQGELLTAVDAVHPIQDFAQAIARAQADKRGGKVLLALGE